jgi:hypothetical protein
MAISHGKAERKAARAARLSAALRENLKLRKAQARGRAQGNGDHEAAPPAEDGARRPIPTFAAIGDAIRNFRPAIVRRILSSKGQRPLA